MSDTFGLGVLVSGGGTNLQAIIDEQEAGNLDNVEIRKVISNNPGAYALSRAEKHGIPREEILPDDFADRRSYEREMVESLRAVDVELVVLAGFMRILGPTFIRAFPERIINIHPSLIPAFAGRGFYGRRVHEAAIDYGVKISGCTVIFVNEEPDGGPIILQRSVPVRDDDTPDDLADRVLREEHRLLPEAIRLIARDALEIEGRRVKIRENNAER